MNLTPDSISRSDNGLRIAREERAKEERACHAIRCLSPKDWR